MNKWCVACALVAALGCGQERGQAESTKDETTATGDVYECPMHCKLPEADEPYRQAEPGQCPVCGMDLEKQ